MFALPTFLTAFWQMCHISNIGGDKSTETVFLGFFASGSSGLSSQFSADWAGPVRVWLMAFSRASES